jgi:hypothetical protein
MASAVRIALKGSYLAIFPDIGNALLRFVGLERTTIERLYASAGGGCGRSSAMSRKISWKICRGMFNTARNSDAAALITKCFKP